MNINLTALSTEQRPEVTHDDKRVLKVDYPKSEPVLESSYVFPKEKRYAEWRISASGSFSVS